MSKAKRIKKEHIEEEIKQEQFKTIDLGQEKRVGLFSQEFDKWSNEMKEKYGIGLSAELVFNQRGIVPRLTVVDFLKKNDGQETPKQE